jgi:hypothetical protein
MKRILFNFFLLASLVLTMTAYTSKPKNHLPLDYKGTPFHDDLHKTGAQTIPGRVQCALFDLGGEGVAYHDADSINNGSGPYNHQPGHCEPGAEYVAYFRINEGVDLSYTKEMLDFSHPNPFTPDRRQQFIGWTRDGETCNYTVNVKKAGTYQVGILYSNKPCRFSLLVNNILAGTYVGPTETASYHTWTRAENVGAITFKKAGLHLLTLQYNGGSNYAYLEFNYMR